MPYLQNLHVFCKLQSMLRENQRQCHICQRLGKAQCGYHKFKNEFLSRLDGSCFRSNQFAQTQSSIHGKSQIHDHHNNSTTLSPERIDRRLVNIQDSEQRHPQPQPHPTNYLNLGWQQNQSRIHVPVPQYPQGEQHQQKVIPIEHHIVRNEGNQTLYYPIYPVYEIVYEEVPKNSSFLSPSRVIYN